MTETKDNADAATVAPNRKEALIKLTRAIFVFVNILAVPYYVQLANQLMASEGFASGSARHVGIIAAITCATGWLISWRV
ncbi:MAG TPA: hypothetical protein VIF83_03120, partial [Gemmatimonadaceae bacterium]